eukprot:654516_1
MLGPSDQRRKFFGLSTPQKAPFGDLMLYLDYLAPKEDKLTNEWHPKQDSWTKHKQYPERALKRTATNDRHTSTPFYCLFALLLMLESALRSPDSFFVNYFSFLCLKKKK